MQPEGTHTLCAASLKSSWGYAPSIAPYSSEAFEKFQTASELVKLRLHADCYPKCRAQEKSLAVANTDPTLKLGSRSLDYDKETKIKKLLNVRNQSPFAVYRSKAGEVRQIGNTLTEAIRSPLSSSLRRGSEKMLWNELSPSAIAGSQTALSLFISPMHQKVFGGVTQRHRIAPQKRAF